MDDERMRRDIRFHDIEKIDCFAIIALFSANVNPFYYKTFIIL